MLDLRRADALSYAGDLPSGIIVRHWALEWRSAAAPDQSCGDAIRASGAHDVAVSPCGSTQLPHIEPAKAGYNAVPPVRRSRLTSLPAVDRSRRRARALTLARKTTSTRRSCAGRSWPRCRDARDTSGSFRAHAANGLMPRPIRREDRYSGPRSSRFFGACSR